MAGRFIPEYSAALTVGGTSTGYVTIAQFDPAKGPFVGATLNLISSAAGPTEYKVTSSNPTTGVIGLRATAAASGGVSYGNSDVSSFTVANTATIYMPAQLDSNPNDDIIDVNMVVTGATDANIKTINGVVPLMGNGATGTGSQRVTVASDNSSIPVKGDKTNNNAAPGANNVGALVGVANASAQTWGEGNLVALSTDLAGNQRVIGVKSHNTAVPSTQLGVISAVANAAAPTLTETYQTLLSIDLGGNLRVDASGVIKKLNGQHAYLGVVIATTTKNNHDTATPFNNTSTALAGKYVMIQPDTACYVLSGNSNAATVTAANGVLVEANEKFTTYLGTNGWVAVLPVVGTTNAKFFELS